MPKEKKVEATEAVGYVDSNYIVDLARDDLGLCFYEQNGTLPKIPKRVLGSRPKQNLHLIPFQDRQSLIRKNVISLPEKPLAYKSQHDLINDLVEFIHKWLDTEPYWELLMAHYYLLTWVYDRFSAVPYLRFLGDTGSGKTRKLEISHALSYKGIMTVAPTESTIFRLVDLFNGTLIIDEADWAKSHLTSVMTQILNAGYKKGLSIPRNKKSGSDFEVAAFQVFGTKVIASRQRFGDSALEDRCLTIQQPDRELREDVPRQIPIRDDGRTQLDFEALTLRNKMLQWRFDNYRDIRVDENDLLKLPARVCETGSTIYSVSQDDEFKKWLLDFLHQRTDKQKGDSPKSRIAQIILRKYLINKKIFFKDIVDEYNEALDDCVDNITGRDLSTYIDDLAISRGKRTGTGNCIEPTNQEIERLKKKYDSTV